MNLRIIGQGVQIKKFEHNIAARLGLVQQDTQEVSENSGLNNTEINLPSLSQSSLGNETNSNDTTQSNSSEGNSSGVVEVTDSNIT